MFTSSRTGVFDDLLGWVGLSGAPEDNLDDIADLIGSREPPQLDIDWWLSLYSTGIGPWALLVSLVASSLVIITNLGPRGNRLKLLLAFTLYAETLLVYFLAPVVLEILIDTVDQLTKALIPSVFPDGGQDGVSFWENLLVSLSGGGWMEMVTHLSIQVLNGVISILNSLIALMPFLIVMAWPLRYLGSFGAGVVASTVKWTLVLLLTAPGVVIVIGLAKLVIINGPDTVPARRFAVMLAVLVAIYVPFGLSKLASKSALTANVKNRLSVGGNVNAKLSGGSGRSRSIGDRAKVAKQRDDLGAWVGKKPVENTLLVVAGGNGPARAAVKSGSYLVRKMKKK